MGTADEGLHNRSVTHDAFYEWLLSDHPDAKTERERRRSAHCQRQQEEAAVVRAWVDKINGLADAPQAARDLAATMGPLAARSAARAETDGAEPDDLYVARIRAEFETHMRVSGPPDSWDYRYPRASDRASSGELPSAARNPRAAAPHRRPRGRALPGSRRSRDRWPRPGSAAPGSQR
jgi:hypothetical protein